MKKRILLTGVQGFIGGALWSFLHKEGLPFEIFGIARMAKPGDKNIFSCDLTKPSEIFPILQKVRPDFIFHLTGGRISDKEKLFEANFVTTRALFEAVQKIENCAPRVIIPATAAEYGKGGLGKKQIEEDVPCQPASWYGVVKFMQTNLSLFYAQKGLDVVVARIFNVMGPATPETLSVGRFARAIALIENKKNDKIIRTRGLSGRRDFVDIRDVCSALVSVAQKGKSGEVYNVCSGTSSTIRSLLHKLLRLSTIKNIAIKEEKENLMESMDAVGSNKKIKKETRWRPVFSIGQSLQDTLDYYRRDMHV